MVDTEMTTKPTRQPDALKLADVLHEVASLFGFPSALLQSATELRFQHAEIARLTAENEALKAKMELVDYVLQDDIHNRLTPRVVDIAYSAFTVGRRDTPHDWFSDTKPMVMGQLAKIKKHLAEEAAHGIGEKP